MATLTNGANNLQPFIAGGKIIDNFSLPNSGNVDPYTGKQLAIITVFTTIAGGSTAGSPRAGIWETARQRWDTTPITLNNTAESSSSATQTFNLTLNAVVHTGATYFGGIYASGGLAMKRASSGGGATWYTAASGGNEGNGYTGTTVGGSFATNIYFVITYFRLPNAPAGTPTASQSGETTTLSWTAATVPDAGGAGDVTGYKIQVSYNGGSTWSTWIENTGSTSTSSVNVSVGDGGATFKQGQSLTFRVAAKNGVCIDFTPIATPEDSVYYADGVRGSTLSSGPYGSSSNTVTVPGGIYNGSSWVPFSNAKVRNASNEWVTPTTFKVYDDGTWKSLI